MNQHKQKVSTPEKAHTSKAQRLDIVELQQKAMEVIALTPEVRREEVQIMKELITKGSYRCNHQHLALNLLADHFLMTGRVACQPVTTKRQNPAAVMPAAGGGEENVEADPFPQ
jgi:anti-sigma28 factor (negative regulator of flagellin synthesis)